MPQEIPLAMTAREKIVAPYIQSGTPHEFRSTPISSVAQFVAEFIENAIGFGFLYFAPQKVKFFRKGEGDRIEFGTANVDSTEAESNLQRGGSTDGSRDMAIEGIQISSCGNLVDFYAGADIAGFGANPTHEGVKRALRGQAVLVDPFSLVTPAQLQSPFLLEEALFPALMRVSSLELALDTSRPFKLGGARLYPGSAGQTMLRASGMPDASNVFPIKEGILWKRDGKSDSDLKMTIELHREIVIPISTVTPPGGNAPLNPKKVFARVAVDLLGVSVSELGEN